MPSTDVLFTAQWELIPTFTAIFTGGTGAFGDSPESVVLPEGKLFVLPENTFGKTDCTFAGWSDGIKTYQPKQSYTMPDGGIVFSAVWDEKPEYKAYVHNVQELIDAVNNAPFGGEKGTIIFENDITDFSAVNFYLSGTRVLGGALQKQNIVLDMQGFTLSGDAFSGQHFLVSGALKITGTKDAKLENCTFYASRYSVFTIENITVSYLAEETERVDLIVGEGDIILSDCTINLNHKNNVCGDNSALTAIRNLPNGVVYVKDGTLINVHAAEHKAADAVNAHKDGTWYGIENLGTVYLQGGSIESAGPAIFNFNGIYHEQYILPHTVLTSGYLHGVFAVSEAYYDKNGNRHYTLGDYTVSDGSYIELNNYNSTTGILDVSSFTEVTIAVKKDVNINIPKFIINLSGEYVYPQNTQTDVLETTVFGSPLSYRWYKNSENTIVGAELVGTDSTFIPSSSDMGSFYYFVVVLSQQYANGTVFKPAIISDSAKVIITSALSEEPMELKHYTGITLRAEAGVLPKNTVMQVTPVKEGGSFALVNGALGGLSAKFTAFDITLIADSAKVQPNKAVTVRIPIPEDFGTENLLVYRINDDGTKTAYSVNVKDGCAEFETDHFSIYALASMPLIDNPSTGVGTFMFFFIALSVISALIVFYLTVIKGMLAAE